MRVESTLDGCEHVVHLTTEHAASSHGQPVVVAEDGSAWSWLDWAFCRVVECTPEERAAFEAAGYHIRRQDD